MKKSQVAIIILGIVIVALSLMTFQQGIQWIYKGQKPQAQEKNVDKGKDTKSLATYGCRVCKIGEEAHQTHIHALVKKAYLTKNITGLAIQSDVAETDKRGEITDGSYVLAVNADIWSDTPDEGMDWLSVQGFAKGKYIVHSGELMGSSWYSTLSKKQQESSMIYISGKYLPTTPTNMDIYFLVFPETDINKSLYFCINTVGIDIACQSKKHTKVTLVNLGKVNLVNNAQSTT